MKKIIEFFKKQIGNFKVSSNDFDVELEDHEIEDKPYYRLHYMHYYRPFGVGIVECSLSYDPFLLPDRMDKKDAFKVLSYLTDFIEKRYDVSEGCLKSVRTLNEILKLRRFGFEVLKFRPDEDEVIDLFAIEGRIKVFLNSKYYSKYFNWYTPNVSKEEVEEIYRKCGMIFEDIVFYNEGKVDSEKIEEEKEGDVDSREDELLEESPKMRHESLKVPDSKKKLYAFIGGQSEFFDSRNELDEFLEKMDTGKWFGNVMEIDYLGRMADREDVIRFINSSGEVRYCSVVDTDGYAVYQSEKSILEKKFIWNFEYGDLRNVYEAFQSRGILLENDVYKNLDECNQSCVLPDIPKKKQLILDKNGDKK